MSFCLDVALLSKAIPHSPVTLGAFAGLYGRAMKKLSGKVQNSLAVCSERAEGRLQLFGAISDQCSLR